MASPCLGAWQNGYNFGATLQGDLFTPTKPGTPPAILVVIHMCTGHSSTVHGWFDSYANTNGFYIIAPDAGKQCFDSSASRDGDKAAIVKMVDTVVKLGGDKTRVFAAGMSSGGCMTNTLLAIYPDIFVGGSAMPGFPAGGWPAGDTSCTRCGSTPPSTDGKFWGDMARKAFAWSGTYPCSQQWVGGGDQYNFNGWLPAVAAQFVNLGGLGSGTAGSGAPSGWSRTVYRDTSGNVRLETNLGPASQMHDLETVQPPLYGNVVSFLGLDRATGACGIASTSGGSGGATGSGGAPGSGGTIGGAGGVAGGTGGTSGTGGTILSGTGGRAVVGGTGGNVTGVGGAHGTPGTGGAISGSDGGSSHGDNSSGCACDIARTRRSVGALGVLALAVLGMTLGRRARRRR